MMFDDESNSQDQEWLDSIMQDVPEYGEDFYFKGNNKDVSKDNNLYYYHKSLDPQVDMHSPYLGLEDIIPDTFENGIPDKIKKETDKVLEDILKKRCKKDDVLNQKHIAHFHCQDCGISYSLDYKNYHDVANRPDYCQKCFHVMNYGNDFNVDWKNLEHDIEQVQINRSRINPKPVKTMQDFENEKSHKDMIDAMYGMNGHWHKGVFYGDNGSSYVDSTMPDSDGDDPFIDF